jgi:hypothetical protein
MPKRQFSEISQDEPLKERDPTVFMTLKEKDEFRIAFPHLTRDPFYIALYGMLLPRFFYIRELVFDIIKCAWSGTFAVFSSGVGAIELLDKGFEFPDSGCSSPLIPIQCPYDVSLSIETEDGNTFHAIAGEQGIVISLRDTVDVKTVFPDPLVEFSSWTIFYSFVKDENVFVSARSTLNPKLEALTHDEPGGFVECAALVCENLRLLDYSAICLRVDSSHNTTVQLKPLKRALHDIVTFVDSLGTVKVPRMRDTTRAAYRNMYRQADYLWAYLHASIKICSSLLQRYNLRPRAVVGRPECIKALSFRFVLLFDKYRCAGRAINEFQDYHASVSKLADMRVLAIQCFASLWEFEMCTDCVVNADVPCK